ncbi:hypothetical protein BASA81_000276 [Batrachochytrium salamandrivorans]|nr:hypothetical protein BASA81_000276 [Batrachochytrium salamandrivorans]
MTLGLVIFLLVTIAVVNGGGLAPSPLGPMEARSLEMLIDRLEMEGPIGMEMFELKHLLRMRAPNRMLDLKEFDKLENLLKTGTRTAPISPMNMTRIRNHLRTILKSSEAMPVENLGYNMTNSTQVIDRAFGRFANKSVISIRGLFASGTGWLRTLLNRNCQELQYLDVVNSTFESQLQLDADGLYGWKHTYWTPYEQTQFDNHPRHFLVVLTRDAFTWAASAFTMRAMLPRKTYIRNTFTDYLAMSNVSDTYPSTLHLLHYYKNNHVPVALIGNHIFDIRRLLYGNWNITRSSSKVQMLQYEQVRNNTAGVIMNLFDQWDIRCSNLTVETFSKAAFRVKMKSVSNSTNLERVHPKTKVCRMLNPKLYARILSQLDLEFERKVLGYDYPNTMEEYCRNVSLVMPPTPTPTLNKRTKLLLERNRKFNLDLAKKKAQKANMATKTMAKSIKVLTTANTTATTSRVLTVRTTTAPKVVARRLVVATAKTHNKQPWTVFQILLLCFGGVWVAWVGIVYLMYSHYLTTRRRSA